MKPTGILISAFSAAVLFSCDLDRENTESVSGNRTIYAGIADYSSGKNDMTAPGGTGNITGISGYLFENGEFSRYCHEFYDTGNGYGLPVGNLSGKLYIIARADGAPSIETPPVGYPEPEWKKTVISSRGAACIFYTGEVSLAGADPGNPAIHAVLTRGVARFDLRIDVSGEALVSRITFENTARKAFLFPGNDVLTPPESDYEDIVYKPDTPADSDTEAIACMLEQESGNVKVRVEATVDGKAYELEAGLPEKIKRNTIYTVTLRKRTADAEISLSVQDWGEGGHTDAVPDRGKNITVDKERSVIPEGVGISDDGRTLVLPHTGTEILLAADCDEELELVPVSEDLISVETDLSAGTNVFRISKKLFAPGDGMIVKDIVFRRKGLENIYPDDRITLKMEANPTVLVGKIRFGQGVYSYDFGTYADNEFGVFTLPEGKKISVEFADGEDRWMTVEPSGDGGRTFRLLGGWRPNDPTADGRKQSGKIVISDLDGTGREEYTVTRRNYGLPVTWLHGVWWCKYNSMGNSRDFADQILSSDDPAAKAGQTLFEYLGACSPEEYYRLWGWAYLGDSGKGMKVVEQDGMAVMEGYKGGSKVNINRLDPLALSPAGYELPSLEDFNRVFDATGTVWVMWDGTHVLTSPWEGHSIVKREQKRKNDIRIGSLTLSDLIYVAMSSPDFPEYEPVVWYGPSPQWDNTGILHYGHYNNILFSVYAPDGGGWYFGGYANGLYLQKNGAGNNDTRILRFKKSDVEYIY